MHPESQIDDEKLTSDALGISEHRHFISLVHPQTSETPRYAQLMVDHPGGGTDR